MNTNKTRIIEKIWLLALVIVVATSLILIWKLLDLPQGDEMLQIIKRYYDEYGLLTIYIAAIVEGTLFVGWYMPGSLVIFMGIILANGDIKKASMSVICTILGLMTAYIIDYCLGRYGWSKLFKILKIEKPIDNAKVRYENNYRKAIYYSYWQPNLAGMMATAAGILKADPCKFLLHSTVATILWCTFWGFITFLFGQVILNYMGALFCLLMLCWVVYLVVKNRSDIKA